MSILGLFIKVTKDELQASTQVQPSVNIPVTVPTSSPSLPGQKDDKVAESLAKSLEENNLPGFDYFEFAQATDAQAAFIPTEEARFKSVFSMAKTMGLDMSKLLSSAQHYLGILAGKEKEFLAAMASHQNEAITAKQQQLKTVNMTMEEKAKQIQTLTVEIDQLQRDRTALSTDITANTTQMDQVKSNFYATLKCFTERINSDVEKIKTYLQQK